MPQAEEDVEESEALPDLQDPLESLDHQEVEECPELMAPQDPRGKQETEGWLDHLDQRASMVRSGDQAHQDCRD